MARCVPPQGRTRQAPGYGAGAELRRARPAPETGAPSGLRLDRLLELRGGREARDLGRRDLDGLARLRVAALTGRALGDGELAKPRERHFIAGAELVRDALEGDLDRFLGLTGAEPGLLGDRLRELGLVDGCH